MRTIAVLFSLPLIILALGCSDPAGPPRIEDTEFASELQVDLSAMTRTASGLYIQDLTVGAGETVQANDFAEIFYTGWLANGDEFDSRHPPEAPLRVLVGIGGVIRGFAEGMLGMQEGGSRRIIIPPHLGYGSSPPPGSGIPRNAILVFEIDLVEVQ